MDRAHTAKGYFNKKDLKSNFIFKKTCHAQNIEEKMLKMARKGDIFTFQMPIKGE